MEADGERQPAWFSTVRRKQKWLIRFECKRGGGEKKCEQYSPSFRYLLSFQEKCKKKRKNNNNKIRLLFLVNSRLKTNKKKRWCTCVEAEERERERRREEKDGIHRASPCSLAAHTYTHTYNNAEAACSSSSSVIKHIMTTVVLHNEAAAKQTKREKRTR